MLSLTLYAGRVLKNNLKRALPDLLHVIVIAAALGVITEYTDWYKVDRYYNHILFCLGFMVVRDTMYMQLCVVTEQKYNQFISANLIFSLVFPAYIILSLNGKEVIREEYFIKGMLVFFCVNYLHFSLSIWTQMADMLGIKVFSIRNKPTRRKWARKKTKFTENRLKEKEKERLAKEAEGEKREKEGKKE